MKSCMVTGLHSIPTHLMERDTFFHGLSSFLLTTGDREAGATSGVAEFVLSKISKYLHVLYAMETTLREGNGGDEELTQ